MPTLILIALGVLLLLAGTITCVVDAFKVNIGWGVAVLLIPGAALVFACVHWSAARRGLLVQLAGVPLFAGAFLLLPKETVAKEKSAVAEHFHSPFAAVAAVRQTAADRAIDANQPFTPAAASAEAAPAPAAAPAAEPATVSGLSAEMLEERRDANRRRFTKLRTTFVGLEARRTTLEVSDPVAVQEFNDDVAAYAADLKAAQLEKSELLKVSGTAQ